MDVLPEATSAAMRARAKAQPVARIDQAEDVAHGS